MKTNSPKPTLEQLLASLEHAGRDARRQQQLADMIEQMAEKEASRRRTIRLRVTRIAVAATVTLFVTTSVWRWLTPSQPQASQAPLRAVVSPTVVTPTLQPAVPTQQPQSVLPVRTTFGRPQPVPSATPSATPTATPDEPVEAPVEVEPALFEIVEPPLPQEEYIAATEPSRPVEEETPFTPQPAAETLAQNETAPAAAPRRHSLFSLRMAEPSLMDGNVLALQIF